MRGDDEKIREREKGRERVRQTNVTQRLIALVHRAINYATAIEINEWI